MMIELFWFNEKWNESEKKKILKSNITEAMNDIAKGQADTLDKSELEIYEESVLILLKNVSDIFGKKKKKKKELWRKWLGKVYYRIAINPRKYR